jgi:hypothetical protein
MTVSSVKSRVPIRGVFAYLGLTFVLTRVPAWLCETWIGEGRPLVTRLLPVRCSTRSAWAGSPSRRSGLSVGGLSRPAILARLLHDAPDAAPRALARALPARSHLGRLVRADLHVGKPGPHAIYHARGRLGVRRPRGEASRTKLKLPGRKTSFPDGQASFSPRPTGFPDGQNSLPSLFLFLGDSDFSLVVSLFRLSG